MVEGAETAEIVNALQVLGVDAAQGFAIARPMPARALQGWLAGHAAIRATQAPTSLLGIYAAHLMISEACRVMATQTMNLAWPDSIHDPHVCLIGRYLDQHGEHDTPYGLAHKRFHATITTCGTDPVAWDEASEAFRDTLETAITAPGRATQPEHLASKRLPEPEWRVDSYL